MTTKKGFDELKPKLVFLPHEKGCGCLDCPKEGGYSCLKCAGEIRSKHGLYCLVGAREALLKALTLMNNADDILAIKDAQNEIRRAEITLNRLERAYYAVNGKGA